MGSLLLSRSVLVWYYWPMARKKLCGYQRKLLAPITRAMKDSPVFSRLVRKRGRPKGETERHREVQKQIHEDLAWLGVPYKPDLYSWLAEKLPDPEWRAEYVLPTPGCPKVYKTTGRRHFRREISFVHRKIWDGPKSRSLWQHWRHQDYRLTRAQEVTIVIGTGNCRGGANLEARKIGRQGAKITMTKRECMSCGNAFSSKNKYNRLCLKCNRNAGGLDDVI